MTGPELAPQFEGRFEFARVAVFGDPGQFGLRLVWTSADAALSLTDAQAFVR